MNNLIQILPRDYLELGAKGRIEEAIAAIWRHVGEAKTYEDKEMSNKEIKDYCKNCDVEPPAMRFKCPECEHNTDKEQIMINGVDVSECEYLTYELEEDGQYYWFCNIAPVGGPDECGYRPECFYKKIFRQLARKTQIIDEIEEVIKPYQAQIELDALSLVGAIKSILERKTQECEELKKANKHIDANRQCKGSKLKRIEDLISACETVYTDEFIQTIYSIIQEPEPTINDYSIIDRYRKALEEIEEVIKTCTEDCVYYELSRCYDRIKTSILDIINKAKGK